MTVSAKNSSKERDQELLLAVAGGNRRALEELYLSYHRRLARFLSRFTPRYENVEEIINDTFMVVWQSAKDFRIRIPGLNVDHRHRLPHGAQVSAPAEEP